MRLPCRRDISARLSNAGLLALLCVLLIHCDSSGASRILTCWAVPFFFFASGYRFGKGDYVCGGGGGGVLVIY